MSTEQVAQNRLCMDKGDFARESVKTSVCPQKSKDQLQEWRGGGEEQLR